MLVYMVRKALDECYADVDAGVDAVRQKRYMRRRVKMYCGACF
jgi:hypothetical protein